MPSSSWSGQNSASAVSQRQLVCRAAQVRHEHVRVVQVDHRPFRCAAEQLVGVAHHPLVELVLACDEHRQALLAGAATPPDLLPERGDRAREAAQHHGVEAADVDPELERVGGDDAAQPAAEQVGLDLATLRGQVAGSIGPHRIGQLGSDGAADVLGDQLGAAPRAAEHQGAQSGIDQPRRQQAGLGVHRPPIAPGAAVLGRTGVPQRHVPWAGGRAVTLDRHDRQAAQLARQHLGVADGGRGEHERRLDAAVVAHQPPQATQHLCRGGCRTPRAACAARRSRRSAARAGTVPSDGGWEGCRGGASRGWSAARSACSRTQVPLLGRAVAVVGGGHHAGQRPRRRTTAAGPGPGPWWGRSAARCRPAAPPRRWAPGTSATCPTRCRWRA